MHSSTSMVPPRRSAGTRIRESSPGRSQACRLSSRRSSWLQRRRRQLDDLEPVPAEYFHRFHQLRESDRLGDEGVHSELVSALQVRVEPRAGQHDDGNILERRGFFDRFQRLASIHLRHVEIQQDESRASGFPRLPSELTAPVQVVEQLLAVDDISNAVRYVRMFQRLPCKHPIVLVVVANENRTRDLVPVMHHKTCLVGPRRRNAKQARFARLSRKSDALPLMPVAVSNDRSLTQGTGSSVGRTIAPSW